MHDNYLFRTICMINPAASSQIRVRVPQLLGPWNTRNLFFWNIIDDTLFTEMDNDIYEYYNS